MELRTNPVRSLAVTGLNFGLLLTTGLWVPRLVPPALVLDLSRGRGQRCLVLVKRARAVMTVILTVSGDMLRLAALHADSPETGFICC